MSKLKSIPAFKGEAEERKFWEAHESTDYIDWDKTERVRFANLKTSTPGMADFVHTLRAKFRDYRRQHFEGRENMFRTGGDAVVFLKEHAAANLLIPPFASNEQRDQIVGMIPTTQRHRHFGSMQSSQAIAQSVFGTIASFNCLPLLANVTADDGRQAF